MFTNNVLETIHISTATGDFTFTAEGWTPRCWWLHNPRTGAYRQFSSRAALDAFVVALTERLQAEHGAPANHNTPGGRHV
ncbi:MAG TPA: hypothetical protein PKD55_00895 [Bellilinea sp.]|nr:hypothetical protein [Bellilinea sp.]